MTKTKPNGPPELRARVVALARVGRSVGDLAREFRLSERTIRRWLRAAEHPGEGPDPAGARGLDEGERDELWRLRRENRRLRRERDALVKNAAWLAQAAWFAEGGRASQEAIDAAR